MHIDTLDLIDRRILAELQRNGRATNVELAERVHLSPAQCYRRQKRLEEAGLIRDYVARLDAEKLGYKVVAFVSVTIANGPYKQPQKFQQAIAGIAEILVLFFVVGPEQAQQPPYLLDTFAGLMHRFRPLL